MAAQSFRVYNFTLGRRILGPDARAAVDNFLCLTISSQAAEPLHCQDMPFQCKRKRRYLAASQTGSMTGLPAFMTFWVPLPNSLDRNTQKASGHMPDTT